MHRRCSNPRCARYPQYGGRGIRVCERWASYDAFLEDMGPAPAAHSLDRIDVNADYSPDNCQWAPTALQQRNTQRSVFVEIDGARMHIKDACVAFDVNYRTAISRLRAGKPPIAPWEARIARSKDNE